jgi:hypothetical protein
MLFPNDLTIWLYFKFSTKEKLLMSCVKQRNSRSSNSTYREEFVGKWAQTSNPIYLKYKWIIFKQDTFNTGSEVVVLGWDPADTHTTNFWEELASVDLSGGAAVTYQSGTFTAKKYLWVQVFRKIFYNSLMHLHLIMLIQEVLMLDDTFTKWSSRCTQGSQTNLIYFNGK